jgi:hypothetical protein
MSESSLFPADNVRRDGELGGCRIRLMVTRGTDLIAKVTLVAEWGETRLIATSSDTGTAAAATAALISALAAEPKSLGRCRFVARALELGAHHNEYGFDGAILLGQHNVNE